MIVTPAPPNEPPVWMNMYRPDLFTDEDRAWWKRIHDCIKTCDIPIVVNGIFNFIDGIIENEQSYGGGGFGYYFWFATEDDRSAFIQLLINDCGVTAKEISNCAMSPPLGVLS